MKAISNVNSNRHQPLVTIGLPVFNGERYLAKTLESLLAQEYRNIEILIFDNASEDGTSDICHKYAMKDSRITYQRNKTNIGPMRNGSRILDAASGEFIMFAADHDLWAPHYISTLLMQLLQDESIVLAYSRTVMIDENDTVTEIAPDKLDTRGLDRCQRFHKIMWEFTWGNMVYGLFRTAIYRQVWKPYDVISPDHVLMASLSLVGHIAQVDEPLFFRRKNRPSETGQGAHRRHIDWFSKTGLASLVPQTLMAYEHVNVIMDSELMDNEKEVLLGDIKECFPTRFGREMRAEAYQLMLEGTKIIADAKEHPYARRDVYLELVKLTNVCRFFYPNIPEVNPEFEQVVKPMIIDLVKMAVPVSVSPLNVITGPTISEALPQILMYHSVSNDTDDPCSVSVDTFRDQMSWLTAKGFEAVTLQFLLRSLQTGNYGALINKVVITFDDGYRDFVVNALPILLEHRATATMFLCTGMLGGVSSWQRSTKPMPLMSEDEIRHIKLSGISLGSHTVTHAKLTDLGQDDLQRQLRDSYDALTVFGESFYSLSYPWGQWSSKVVDAVNASGYECALTTAEQPGLTAANVNKYLLPRIFMGRHMDLNRFQSLLMRTHLETESLRLSRNLHGTMVSAQIRTSNGELTGAGIMRNEQIRLHAGENVDLTKGMSATMTRNVPATTGTTPVSNTKLVKISFVMIVLNGMPFVEYALKAIYDEAHEIIIVEGAVEECFFAANPDGSSTDGTVECIRSFHDPYRKIQLIQGRWQEKCEMQNAALSCVTGNYVWLVDSDEIYKREDISKIRSLLANDPTITQVNVIGDNFWKGFDFIFESPKFFETPAHWRRIFKYVSGARFTTHRPPTMIYPGHELSTEQMHLIDGTQTRAMGIVPFHYSYVLESQVRQKIELYNRYGWGKMWNLDLIDWYNNFYLKWTPENRRELERLYPIWTGDSNSYSVPFTGTHPEVMEELITACPGGELSSQAGSDKTTPRTPVEQDALATAGAARCNLSKKFRIAGEGVIGSDLTQIQEGSGFETSLREIVLSIKPRTIIETGTYMGNGTTRIIATALRAAGLAGTTFYSIECNPVHHRQACFNLDQAGLLPFVKPLLGLSVPRNLLPSIDNILDDTVRNVVEDGIFVDHQEQDRVARYYHETDFPDIPEDLIGACLEQFGRRPDLVLLDSAGHMGGVEFDYVVERLQGECYLVLDDIRHVKHYRSFQQLQKDPRFTVITSSDEKFGFCIARFNPGTKVEPTVERRWILWVRPDSIGDNILAMAMLPYLKARRPDAAIVVFCQEHIAELYEACPAVDRVITFNRMRALQDEAYRAAILGQLQEIRADICLNSLYSRDLLADFFAARSGAQERIALMGDLSNTSAEDREAYNQFYTSILTSAGEHKPEMYRHQDFLRGIGITDERLKPSLWMLPDDIAFSDRFFKEQCFEPEKTIALFAGAQSSARLYDKYGTGIAAFCRENGFSVVALGAACDYGINQYNLDAIGVTTVNLSGATTLRQGAAILSRCRLAVGAETGLAHMACAVGTPNIIVLGGGHFGRFIPYSPLTSVVCLPLECYGCNWRCRYERAYCVRDVSPAVIAEALRHSLAGRSDRIRYFVQGDSLWEPEDGGPTRDLSTRFMLVEGEFIMVENT